jgi:SAM-dependent methyltransferase
MKLDHFIKAKLLGRPYHSTVRRFEEERKLALESAAIVVGKINEIMPVRSVVDVGCGIGNWLSVFRQQGADRIVGIDGDYIDRSRLAISPSAFIARDLNLPLAELALGRFDLAMSLEVGEHLEPARTESLVDDLCALSDLVLYGAAIVGQAGDGHINEQWQSFWVEKFSQRDYLAYDVLRPMIWGDRRVAYWYRQNAIFHVKRGSAAHAQFAQGFGEAPATIVDVVHPELYSHRINVKRGMRRLAKNLRRIGRQLTGTGPGKPAQAASDSLVAPQRNRA